MELTYSYRICLNLVVALTVVSFSISATAEVQPRRKANQNVAQGLSLAETKLASDNPWGFTLGTSSARGLAEYDDTWASSTQAGVVYKLNEWSVLGAELGYNSLLYKKDGAFLDNEVVDPDRYGVTDLSASFSVPRLWSDYYNRLAFSSSLSLPTSRLSQNASMIAGWYNRLAMRYTPVRRVIVSPFVGFSLNSYRYDDADVKGYQVNSPFGANYGLSASLIVWRDLTGLVSYSHYQRLDYDGHWDLIQSASARLSYTASEHLGLFGGYQWQDRTFTNEPLFSANRVSISLGVSYAFN